MSLKLSVESLSPSERALLAHQGLQSTAREGLVGHWFPINSAIIEAKATEMAMLVEHWDWPYWPAPNSGFVEAKPASITAQPNFRGKVTGPVRALLSIFDRWQIDDRDASLFLGRETAQFVRGLRAGTEGLNSRDAKDRARLLIEIYEGVYSLLRDPAAERAWISAPVRGLRDRSALEIMRGGSVADLLQVKAFVDHVNGR